MKYIVKNENESFRGKAKIYFTCHPDDRKLYFKEITDSILKYADCVIFYDENPDMPEVAEGEDFFFNLLEMRFIVIPITSNFIYKKECFARNVFDFAMEKHIAVLPILEEESLDMDKVNEVCRNLQFLNPHEKDITAISYDEKLKKYLDSMIVGGELEQKIKEEFSSYIFLSYRKKDRQDAQRLMELIHNNDFCRDVAIWYDEFLTPGENFNNEIEEALKKSDLFALTVTPNIVNEENYIMSTEYPMALDNDKEILPVEMKKTDYEKLNENYNALPEIVSTENVSELNNSLKKLNPSEVLNNDPEHLYLIGLAYKNGIDMEVNKQKGIELIEKSANAGFEKAIRTMIQIYTDGDCVKYDEDMALFWQEKIVEKYENIFSQTHDEKDELILADEINNLGELYSEYYTNVYDSDKALEMYEKALKIKEKILGTGHIDTAKSYDNIGNLYRVMGNVENKFGIYKKSVEIYSKALEMFKKALEIRKKVLGTEHIDTAQSYDNIGEVYSNTNEYEKAIEMHEKSLKIKKKVLGTENIDIAETYYNIGKLYSKIDKYEKAIEMYEKAVNVREKVLDDSAGYFCEKIAGEYEKISKELLNVSEYKKSLAMTRKAINIGKRIDKFPEEQKVYSKFIISNGSNNIIYIYNEIGKRFLYDGEYDKAIKMYKKVLRNINKKVIGTDCYIISIPYNNMGDVYLHMGDVCSYTEDEFEMYEKALEMYEKALDIRKEKNEILYNVGTAITYNKIGYIYEHFWWHNYNAKGMANEMYEKAALIKEDILSHVRSNVEESPDEIWAELCDYSENFNYNIGFSISDKFDICRKYFEFEYLKEIYPDVEEWKLYEPSLYESYFEVVSDDDLPF